MIQEFDKHYKDTTLSAIAERANKEIYELLLHYVGKAETEISTWAMEHGVRNICKSYHLYGIEVDPKSDVSLAPSEEDPETLIYKPFWWRWKTDEHAQDCG